MIEKITLENSLKNGYQLEFGYAFDKAFEVYKKIALSGGLVYIILTIFISVFFIGGFMIAYGSISSIEMLSSFKASNFETVGQIFYVIATSLLSALMSPISAGLIQMSREVDCGKEAQFATAFNFYKGKKFQEIFIASFLIAMIVSSLNLLFEIIDYSILGTVITTILSFFTLLTLPVIIFSDTKGIDAISTSIKLVLKNPLLILGLMIISYILAMLGFIALCIGIFFTLPLVNAMYYAIYLQIDSLENDEISEIGQY